MLQSAPSTKLTGPGNDEVVFNRGTFNGGAGDDYVSLNDNGTFAGGGGDDCWGGFLIGYPGVIWSADPGTWTAENGCTYPPS